MQESFAPRDEPVRGGPPSCTRSSEVWGLQLVTRRYEVELCGTATRAPGLTLLWDAAHPRTQSRESRASTRIERTGSVRSRRAESFGARLPTGTTAEPGDLPPPFPARSAERVRRGRCSQSADYAWARSKKVDTEKERNVARARRT